ncbi:MAG: hypothetical protein HGA47_01315 [Zoogloea sp.]|nr:hypothetical protein [Zoogloea sp.]
MAPKHSLPCMLAILFTLAAACPPDAFAAGTSPLATPGAHVIRVGPQRLVRSIADAARQARDGDVVEIEAGDYVGDVAVWNQSNLSIRGVGGMARLAAGGADVEGKGIWVIRGRHVVVENIAFSGARVSDANGAGIRQEGGSLKVVNCVFKDNENGILTSNDPAAELEIEGSEFGNNGAGDGQSHNLYVGAIRRLVVRDSYFHHARVGHLLKSRAQQSTIVSSRLTDEVGGEASYELEFPNGGVAYVIGNIIEQSAQTENPTMVSFGAEGYKWPRNELYLVNNTLVDNRPQGGVFLKARPGADRIRAVNNLLVGRGRLESAGPGEYVANFNAEWSDVAFASREDFRLKSGGRLVGKAVAPGEANGMSLQQTREYVHPQRSRALESLAANPGALQQLAR